MWQFFVSVDFRGFATKHAVPTKKRQLEQFHKLCSVFGAEKEASAVEEGDGLEGRFGRRE